MRKTILTLSLFAATTLVAQQNPDPVISKSSVVANIPNHSQGFLIMNDNPNVKKWEVDVLTYYSNGELLEVPELVVRYESTAGRDYVKIDKMYFSQNDYSFRITGYDTNGAIRVQEDHVQALIDEPVNELQECNLRCEGSDYAWRLKVYENVNNGSQSLVLDHGFASLGDNQGTAPTPFYENIPNDAMGQIYFEQQAALRNVNITNYNTNEWDLVTTNPMQPPKDKNNTPITTSSYYKLKKDLGKWRPYVGSSTGSQTPSGGSFCSYQMSVLKNAFYNYCPDAPFYQTIYVDPQDPSTWYDIEIPLGCDGKAHTGNEPGDGPAPGTMTGVTGTQPIDDDFVPCENGQQPFSHYIVFDEQSGEWIVVVAWDWPAYFAFLEDCYNNNVLVVQGEDPEFPGVDQVSIYPVSVDGTAPDPITYIRGGNNSGTEPSTLPQGLYLTKRHYGNGLFFSSYTEIGAGGTTKSANPVSRLNSFKVSLAPNPASDQVQVNIGGKKTGALQLLASDGRTLKTIEFEDQSELTLSVEDLPVGLYWVKVNANNQTITEKLVKK